MTRATEYLSCQVFGRFFAWHHRRHPGLLEGRIRENGYKTIDFNVHDSVIETVKVMAVSARKELELVYESIRRARTCQQRPARLRQFW